jgi:hypothetical protein
MHVIMQAKKMTISMLGVNINRQFNYPRYFSMVPGGDEGTLAFSRGWFEIATAQTPRPETVALIAADAEFGKTASTRIRMRRRDRAAVSRRMAGQAGIALSTVDRQARSHARRQAIVRG